VFTTNCFKAAPVLIDMDRIPAGEAQAILTNSGNANAATGREGEEDALAVSRALAEKLGIGERLILLGSTGVIGRRLPVDAITAGMEELVAGLHEEGIADAEEAIMTTDRFPKMVRRTGVVGGKEVTLCGIAKGAGMIEPHMATMLAYFMTDAAVSRRELDRVLRNAVGTSFNSISVDGCMSTNDTALILANGAARNRPPARGSHSLAVFAEMLASAAADLAAAMVRDGEGATKLIDITITGARTVAEARKAAYAVGRSNLVKAAFFGGDPNWGRIIAAVGSVGIPLPVEAVEVRLEELPIFRRGCGVGGSDRRLEEIMGQDTVHVTVHLGMGDASWHVAASDLTFEYVRINAHYHT
jgi:glutamate N-acetyltransferase / amino-acid N-acetyltransferase